MIPEADVVLVRTWAQEQTPVEFRDQVRIEVDETERGVTIVECRRPWSDQFGSEWTRQEVARLNYAASRKVWTLYWADRNSKFHRYIDTVPTKAVVDLLDEIEADPTCIFWG